MGIIDTIDKIFEGRFEDQDSEQAQDPLLDQVRKLAAENEALKRLLWKNRIPIPVFSDEESDENEPQRGYGVDPF